MNSPDFNTCKAIDVIRHSALIHPSLFRDSLMAVARNHFNYASQTADKLAARAAHNAGRDTQEAIHALDCEDFSRISAKCGILVQAFTVAARLNCLSPLLAKSIIERDSTNAE